MNQEEKNRTSDTGSHRPELDELNELKHLLRRTMPPLSPDQLEPHTDLYPQLRARIERQIAADRKAGSDRAPSGTRMRVPWFDWALAAAAGAALLFFPGIIPALLYHF